MAYKLICHDFKWRFGDLYTLLSVEGKFLIGYAFVALLVFLYEKLFVHQSVVSICESRDLYYEKRIRWPVLPGLLPDWVGAGDGRGIFC